VQIFTDTITHLVDIIFLFYFDKTPKQFPKHS
jgi:hypothetical protein